MSQENSLSSEMIASLEGISFGPDTTFMPVDSNEALDMLGKKINQYFDFRASIEGMEGVAPLSEGLAFDPEKLRVQMFVLLEQEEVVGGMTMIIAPKPWIAKQRYFERVGDEGVIVRDFKSVSGGAIPEFLIIPAWTKVDPKHLTKFAIPGFTAFEKLYGTILENAPEDTWVEAVAQGKHTKENVRLNSLANRDVGTFIGAEELGIPLDDIGINSEGSSSSMKMARLIGLKEVDNIASTTSLGPIFVKHVK
ncbi:hypothetical protein ACFL13_03015 [Patescibacteria group bacterium]